MSKLLILAAGLVAYVAISAPYNLVAALIFVGLFVAALGSSK